MPRALAIWTKCHGFDVRDVDLQKVELEHEALAQVTRADADGVERLHGLDGPLHVFPLVRSGGHDLLGRGPEVAVFVDVADDEAADLLRPRRGVAHVELPRQVVGQVGGAAERVLEGKLLVLLRHPRVVAVFDVVLEVGVVVDLVEGILLLLGGRFLRELGGLGLFLGLGLGLLNVRFGLFLAGLLGELVEERVLQELLVEDFLELEFRQLQQLDRLLQRRRHDQLLREFEMEFLF